MEDLKVREQGTIKVKFSTAMILGGIIFLASLFSGWLTQSKDIGSVAAEQKILAGVITNHGTRITIVEEATKTTKDNIKDIKEDLKEVRSGQQKIFDSLLALQGKKSKSLSKE